MNIIPISKQKRKDLPMNIIPIQKQRRKDLPMNIKGPFSSVLI
jgi:hypothetical protein